jgi:hypothetical protein
VFCSFIIPIRFRRTTYKWMTLPSGNSLCCETSHEFQSYVLHEESLSHDKAVPPFATRFAGMRTRDLMAGSKLGVPNYWWDC